MIHIFCQDGIGVSLAVRIGMGDRVPGELLIVPSNGDLGARQYLTFTVPDKMPKCEILLSFSSTLSSPFSDSGVRAAPAL
jgi:hypothetical protein